jgi:tRNA nucleotidyltransferase (CCA-adding enzyme)
LALIPSGLAALPALTGDRLRHEFELIFNEPHAAQMLMRLDALGILAASHPALHWGIAETERIAGVDQWRWDKWKIERAPLWAAVWFGLLFRGNAPPEVRDGLRRLNLSKLPQDAITAGLQIQLPPAPSPSAVVQICEAHPASASVVAYACYPEWRVELHRFLSDWRWARAQTTGDDLIRRGLRPGPRFRAALWALRAARLDGETEAAGEAAWLDLWLKKN